MLEMFFWDITNYARVDATSESSDQGHGEVKYMHFDLENHFFNVYAIKYRFSLLF